MAINGKSPLSQAIEQSGLSNKKLERLCLEHGLMRPQLVSIAEGRSRPPQWLAREIADMFDRNVDELFPPVS